MKGLLLKDLYVLIRQMRLFMVAIFVLCVVNEQLATFGIMYAAMLPLPHWPTTRIAAGISWPPRCPYALARSC